MSERLQVILDKSEMDEIREIARRRRLTVAAWVRQALRAARQEEPRVPAGVKLAAVREAVTHSFPTGAIETMLAEVEQGYQR